MHDRVLTETIKREAQRLGFDLVGVCDAVTPPGIDRFRQWLEAGYAGQMLYLPARASAYAHPAAVLEGVRSIVMLGLNYGSSQPAPVGPGEGRVSRYAWGERDYHDVIHQRLKSLVALTRQRSPDAALRGVVDTAPLLERDFGRLAGLGWIGKNTLLLNPQAGSWFFLAALLTDVPLEPDRPFESDHCGTCRACLDACPTDAFPQPYVLDATRCISYLTIELRDRVPHDLRAGVGDWLFGCDVCQDVCPWNRHAPVSRETVFRPQGDLNPMGLIGLFELDDAEFRKRFRHTPLWRSKRRGILRNAAIVLGNQRDERAVGALARGLHDAEPLVRSTCAWALGRYATERARQLLRQRDEVECDPTVRDELREALR